MGHNATCWGRGRGQRNPFGSHVRADKLQEPHLISWLLAKGPWPKGRARCTHTRHTHTHTLQAIAHTRSTLNMHVTRMEKRRAFIIDNNNGDEWNDQKQTEQVQYIKLRVECMRMGNALSNTWR